MANDKRILAIRKKAGVSQGARFTKSAEPENCPKRQRNLDRGEKPMSTNPFLVKSTLEYELPPFALITEAHYLEAFYAGTTEQLTEIAEILAQVEVTFENTIEALERSGATLNRVLYVFYNK